MSEYYFAVHTGRIPGGKKAASKRHRIARKIDRSAGYVYYYDAARHEWRGWGYCRNLGHPFDSSTAKAIEEAWSAAGV